MLKSELHCHNVFSNFNVGEFDPPYDCNVTIHQQLEQSYNLGLDVLFVTNHNTLDGYPQMLEYKQNHEKYKNIRVYPAEEVTTDLDEHILVYGISNAISPGLSIGEILDEAKKQNALSIAPHPFGLADALREKAKSCDLIEIFNSSNVDRYSNVKAKKFALENKMIGVAGSDSHVISSLGKCLNQIDSENNLDDIISNMKNGKISIQKTEYITIQEILEHAKYKIDNSKDYIHDYVTSHHEKSQNLFWFILKLYEKNPNSYLWTLLCKLSVFSVKRISKKINMHNYDDDMVKNRDLKKLLKVAFLP